MFYAAAVGPTRLLYPPGPGRRYQRYRDFEQKVVVLLIEPVSKTQVLRFLSDLDVGVRTLSRSPAQHQEREYRERALSKHVTAPDLFQVRCRSLSNLLSHSYLPTFPLPATHS